jgi:hypothetical protein
MIIDLLFTKKNNKISTQPLNYRRQTRIKAVNKGSDIKTNTVVPIPINPEITSFSIQPIVYDLGSNIMPNIDVSKKNNAYNSCSHDSTNNLILYPKATNDPYTENGSGKEDQ